MLLRTLWFGAVGFVLGILAIGVPFFIWAMVTAPPKYASTRIYNNASQLNLAIRAYVQEAAKSHSKSLFPGALSELVSDGYLSQHDLKHLTSRYITLYTPPMSADTGTDVVLTLVSDTLVVK